MIPLLALLLLVGLAALVLSLRWPVAHQFATFVVIVILLLQIWPK